MTTPDQAVVIEDCAGLIKLFSDGSILRSPDPIFPVPIAEDENVLWKHLQFGSAQADLPLRLYKPRNRSGSKALPILLYLHGGGFCFGSCTWPHVHACCVRLASELDAVVVAPDYRLAPEHRLPAALDDALSALAWLRAQAVGPDGWLAGCADFENVIVVGDSCGGTIAHHLAVRLGSAGARAELAPLGITKYVLLGPFFGGTRRTRSETDCAEDAFMNLGLIDQFWRLSLPLGADADHPLANPFGPASESLDSVELGPMLVVVGECDLLRDRGAEYGERLKGMGKAVEVVEFEAQEHGFFTHKPSSEAAGKLVDVLKKFVYGSGSSVPLSYRQITNSF